MPERLPTPRYCQVCGHYLVERYVAADKRMRLQCENCGFIHYINPRVIAAIIVSHNGRVLLQQRAMEPRAGFWTFPGGFLEVGETVEDGARRETREEVWLEVNPSALVGVYTRAVAGIVLVVFEGESPSDAAIVGDDESLQVRWFLPEEIPWEELAFETTAAALRDWLSRHAS
jgi:ADP-ribose pyrophosphatase YjhB (NUDIX family)